MLTVTKALCIETINVNFMSYYTRLPEQIVLKNLYK